MKYLGMIMIISVSSYLGIMITLYHKRRIVYIENVIYMAGRIKLLLSSTMPTTLSIMNEIYNDDYLKNFKIDDGNYILMPNDFIKVKSLMDSVGMYDIDAQLNILTEFITYFSNLKNKYYDEYSKSYKLYIFGGISIGIVISVLLI